MNVRMYVDFALLLSVHICIQSLSPNHLERNYESTKNIELDQACFQQQTTIIESIETFQYMKEITHEIYIEYNYAYVICKVLFG